MFSEVFGATRLYAIEKQANIKPIMRTFETWQTMQTQKSSLTQLYILMLNEFPKYMRKFTNKTKTQV